LLFLAGFKKESQVLMYRYIVIFVIFLVVSPLSHSASVERFLPKDHQYDASIIKPEARLGFGIGERHVRHDQMLDYMRTLSAQSARIQLEDIGHTYELRKQVLMTVSSPQNLARLDEIIANRDSSKANNSDPLVVWLGYSVHGDEISGTNAAMVVAYHLAASQEKLVQDMLDDVVIVMEPSINPDGMDRFVNWVNNFRGAADNADPNHIEHHQGWRTGRTNHFGFDLNRDWLLLSQQESQNRLKHFHRYQPNVLGDFHEMGANGTYFFQPGIPTRNHPLTPKKNTEFTQTLAHFHAKALDQEERLYYSEENFDDFYYGKGSTYPDINGSVGILFEQASSRGMQQQTDNGLLTFEYGVKNHVITSLSTLEGSWQNKQQLKQYRSDFYKESLKLAKKEKFSGYLLNEPNDKQRLNYFLDKLAQHQISAYPLAEDFRHNNKLYSKDNTFYVPLEQAQYRVVKALFNTETFFEDNTFYDVSGWTMPLAMDIDFQRIERTWGLSLREQAWQQNKAEAITIEPNAYAYVFEWHHMYSPKLLNALLQHNVKAKVSTKTFSATVDNNLKDFKLGSIVIPSGIQTISNWREIVAQQANKNQIAIDSLVTGFTQKGIDIGSGSFRLIKQPKVLLVGGKGASQYEAAETLFYLDQLQRIPVSIIEHQRLSKVDLSSYTHILFNDGNYAAISNSLTTKIEQWTKNGGILVAQKRGAKWLSEKGILKVDFVSESQIDQLFDTDGLSYQDKEQLAGKKRIAGAIFESVLDQSHPLGFGFSDAQLPMFRNSTLIMDLPSKPFVTLAKYSQTPLMSGYTDNNLVNRIANNAAVVAHNVGKGKVIATSDNMAFRGYWLGSARLLANSLFFADAFNASAE